MQAPKLTFDHQDGPLAFAIARAVYAIGAEGKFSCSVECETNDACDFMSSPVFCFMRASIDAPELAVGHVLHIPYRQEDREDFDMPSTHLYAGSHFDPWDASVEILRIDGRDIEVSIRFLTDDPKYYNSRAATTRGHCRVWLKQVPDHEVRDLM